MVSPASAAAYEAARHAAALVDRRDRGRIIVSGADRASYLQGLLTNDITSLARGQGCYAAYLTPQGRMIADLFVYELGDLILLSLPLSAKDAVLQKLDQFIFTEDVKLGDVTGAFDQFAIVGPDAAARLASLLDVGSPAALTALAEHGNVRAQAGGEPAIVTRVTDPGESGFDVYAERAVAAQMMAKLRAAGVPDLDAETTEAIRLEAGVPKFGAEMNDETIPLEAGIEPRAISFTKGCYVGQEVIIRVLHRGHGRVARKLVGLTLEGTKLPSSGTVIRGSDRDIGHVTSAAHSFALKRPIALGYVHRDFTAPGTAVSVDGVPAVVTAVPFI